MTAHAGVDKYTCIHMNISLLSSKWKKKYQNIYKMKIYSFIILTKDVINEQYCYTIIW